MAGVGYVWWGWGMLVGGVHGRGACLAGGGHAWRGGMHAMHSPPRHYEIRSVNARVVRILLECILVGTRNHAKSCGSKRNLCFHANQIHLNVQRVTFLDFIDIGTTNSILVKFLFPTCRNSLLRKLELFSPNFHLAIISMHCFWNQQIKCVSKTKNVCVELFLKWPFEIFPQLHIFDLIFTIS